MRIGIDARFLGPEGTGIGRYVEKLIENLEIIDKENDYFIFLRRSNFHLFNPKNPKFTKVMADAYWYSVKEQMIMPQVLVKQKLDLVHFPQVNVPLLYPGKFVVTLHDLTKVNFKDKAASTRSLPVYLAKQFAFGITLRQALARSAKILTPSNYVKNEIVKQLGVNKDKLVVTYEGADNFFEGSSISEGRAKEVLSRYSISSPYFLYVGNAYPYKNLSKLVESLPSLKPEIKLVVVSKRDTFLEKILSQAEALGVRNRLILTGWVSDEDLKVIFKEALALVFPSLSEGFGLPGLEAMARGCPVVASRATSLPEVYEEAALYFDPNSTSDISKKLTKIYEDKKLRVELIKKGLLQVKKYSWLRTAEETLEVYKSIA